MKKIINLKPVSAEKHTIDYGEFGKSIWWIHELTDGVTRFRHWNKSKELDNEIKERVLKKVGKTRLGVPVSRMVNII